MVWDSIEHSRRKITVRRRPLSFLCVKCGFNCFGIYSRGELDELAICPTHTIPKRKNTMQETLMNGTTLNYFNADTSEESECQRMVATVDSMMAYHPWSKEQVQQGAEVRDAIGEAIKQILLNVAPSPMRTRAINHLVDARMIANAAITFKGEF